MALEIKAIPTLKGKEAERFVKEADKAYQSKEKTEVIAECRPFSCGNADLDEFFQHDAPLYSKQMLGKSYCFRLDEDSSVIVCAFTLSNDSIRVDMLPNSREKKVRKNIPRSKQMRRYPGVLIGRLGINVDFAHRGIGSELMEFIKSWFLDAGNKTGCRFLIVDAYNEEIPLVPSCFPARARKRRIPVLTRTRNCGRG